MKFYLKSHMHLCNMIYYGIKTRRITFLFHTGFYDMGCAVQYWGDYFINHILRNED